jgi:hypothetical protein
MDQMAAPQPKELSGWKAIASRLGVGVRTAQDYEKNLGLPVHRQPGEKGRVFADPAELDAWRMQTSSNGSPVRYEDAAADTRARAPVRKIRLRPLLIAAVSGVAVLALGAYLVLVPHGPPSDFRVDGKNLVVVNGRGQELWRHTFGIPLLEGAYRQESKLLRNWFGDLGDDGQMVFVFTVSPVNYLDVGTQVLCFAANGEIIWRFDPGRPVTDVSGDRMIPPYFTDSLHVFVGKTRADTRIAVSSHHYLSQPNQVAFLDVQGRVVGEYWHPGHLLHSGTADLDHDGRKELLLAGVNNGNHQATLVVLDPLRVVGLMTPTEMRDRRFELLGMAPSKERAVVFFPRSCISQGQPYTRASRLRVTRDRLVVDVAEGVSEADNPVFVYELDYGLNVLDLTPGDVSIMRKHQALEARGRVDHPFSEECERLKAGVVVRRASEGPATARSR